MAEINEAAVMQALSAVQEPELGKDIVTLEMVKELVLSGSSASLMIELTTPACPLKDVIERDIRGALDGIGVQLTELRWGAKVRRAAAPSQEKLLPNIRNVVAVASGKGGVGKSTVSVNLAVALAQSGARVGLLDADITGPNLPQMLGATGTPKSSPGGKIEPIERHGVKLISIQFFVPEGQPIVWRGPLIGGAIQQFLRDVEWGDLDYLVVDLPPGTSDAQLTLAQAVPLAGAVLVTIPLGALKAGSVRFLPALPARKIAAIGRLGFGSYHKAFFLFDPDVALPQGPVIRMRHDGGLWSEWCNLEGFLGKPVLMALNAGAAARQAEQMSDSEIAQSGCEFLRRFTGFSIPAPTAVVSTRWGADPLTRGAYSFSAVDSGPHDRRALAEPLPGGVHFAGAAVSIDYPSTAHGALLSGRAAGRRILAGLRA